MTFPGEPLEADVGLESPGGGEAIGRIDDLVVAAVKDRDRDLERFRDIRERVLLEVVEKPLVDSFPGIEGPVPVVVNYSPILAERLVSWLTTTRIITKATLR
ncbi:hypothetical protein [Natrinema salaciae]|uniref:Uncharacterized protein n=1 Tax=Natrinema salaciae TaxID=1186196 RepID=A0A1H9AHA0_9EURY|nr:hypothetical protein SAMN04489841_0454 [Natrinema salaciae]